MASSRFFRNVFSNYAFTATSAAVTLILTPVLFRHLGPNGYAVYALAVATAAALEVLDLGMLNASIRHVSMLIAQRSFEDLNTLVTTVFFVLSGIGLVTATALAALSSKLPSFFHLTGVSPSDAAEVLVLVGLAAAFQLSAIALVGHLMGSQDFHLLNAVEIAIQLLRLGGTLWLAWSGFGLVPIVAVIPAAAALRWIGLLVTSGFASTRFVPRWSARSFRSLKPLWEFASLSFVQDTATKWYLQLDRFLAAKLLPLPELAILNVARRIPAGLWQVVAQPMGVTYPMVATAAATGDRKGMAKFMLVSTRLILAAEVPLGAALIVWAGPILNIWIGPGVESGTSVFQILVLFTLVGTLQEAPLTLLYGVGTIRLSTALSVVMLVGASLAAIPMSAKWGLVGLAVAYTGTYALGTLILLAQAIGLTGLGWSDLLRKSFGPVLLITIPALAWFLTSFKFLSHSLLGMTFSIAIGLIFSGGLFIFITTGFTRQPWRARFKALVSGSD